MDREAVDREIIVIREEPIALYKLLKLGNLVASGAEAKYVVSERLVKVNGVVETQKGKKVFAGDTVTFQEMTIQVAIGD